MTDKILDLDALTAQIEAAVAPVRELQARVATALSPFTEMHQRLKAQIDDWNAGLEAVLHSPGFRETMASLEAALKHVRELPAEMQEQLIALAGHGWYIDPEIPVSDMRHLRDAFKHGQVSEGNAWFERYFRSNLEAIEARLVQRHPSRGKVIAAAFRAHRAGEYELSVPPFLTQADGIAWDLHQRELFSKQDRKGIRGLIDTLPPGDFNRVLWEVFRSSSPLTEKTSALPAGFEGLNRHAVLHGVDANYGSEANSLRALSLLNYVAYALAH